MILWWVGNALLALVALPIAARCRVPASSGRFAPFSTRSRPLDIAGSVESVSATVPPVVTTLSTVAAQCRRLESLGGIHLT